MASWYLVSLKFLGRQPAPWMLDILEDRLRDEADLSKLPKPGAAQQATKYFADYDMPAFKGKPGWTEVPWRSPLDTKRIRGLLHVLGFPNVYGEVRDRGQYDDVLYLKLTEYSRDIPMTEEEIAMVWDLFPEFILPDLSQPVEGDGLGVDGLDLV